MDHAAHLRTGAVDRKVHRSLGGGRQRTGGNNVSLQGQLQKKLRGHVPLVQPGGRNQNVSVRTAGRKIAVIGRDPADLRHLMRRVTDLLP